jgi:hypothetical protein
MVHHEPEAARVMEKNQRKDDGKRHPYGELLIDRHAGERVEEKVSRDGYADGGAVIDVHGTDEVTLLTLEFELAMRAVLEHFERFCVELPDTATRTAEAERGPQHSE